ncbi:MAG TPA: hypothetical protein DCS43_05535 [Verrucomicrobia bacterium]|nr:hypothetical protein [Verrucomicrobiota bacterium]
MYASGALCAYAIERRISTRIGVRHLREGVIEMVEAWGRGMPLILKYEPDVKFREMADIFIAAFDRPSYQRGFDEEHSPAARGTTVGETVGEKVGETQEKSSPKSSSKSSPKTEERIIALIAGDSTISTERMGERLGISKRAVLKQTRKLQDENRLKRIGPANGGHWEVLK